MWISLSMSHTAARDAFRGFARRAGKSGPLLVGLLLAGSALVAITKVHAHGGVPIGEDKCVFRVDGQRTHMAAYQPDRATDPNKPWCRLLPDATGRTFLVFDLVDDGLRRAELMAAIVPADRKPATEAHTLSRQAVAYRAFDSVPSGTFSLSYDFGNNPGEYRVVVLRTDKDAPPGGMTVRVGGTSWPRWTAPAVAGFAALLVAMGLNLFRRRTRRAG